MDIVLIANQEVGHHATGRYFRILSTTVAGDIDVRITAKGRELYRGKLSAGIGIDFSDREEYQEPFDTIHLKSVNSQTVRLWAEIAKADDDRSGAAAVLTVSDTAGSSSTPVIQTLDDAVNGTEVLPLNAARSSALIQLSGDCYIDSLANGVLVSGTIQHKNRAALLLIPVSAGVEVRIFEELN